MSERRPHGKVSASQGWGDYSREDLDLALAAMEQTGTLHLAARLLPEVSGGEAQMVMIARALAQEAPILLLDEATSALDAAHKIRIFDLLKEKNRQGLTVLAVMHDINLAALYCQRLIFFKTWSNCGGRPQGRDFYRRYFIGAL